MDDHKGPAGPQGEFEAAPGPAAVPPAISRAAAILGALGGRARVAKGKAVRTGGTIATSEQAAEMGRRKAGWRKRPPCPVCGRRLFAVHDRWGGWCSRRCRDGAR